MQRPIGVTLLAVGAGLAGLFEIWRALVFLGIANFSFVGKTVSFTEPQWGSTIWALIIAAIWFWVATGFWNVRAYAWSFGIFISIFTVIFGFFALLGGNGTMESETIGWLLRDRHLLLPQLSGCPGRLRPARDVAPDPRAEGRDGADAGRAAGDGPGDRRRDRRFCGCRGSCRHRSDPAAGAAGRPGHARELVARSAHPTPASPAGTDTALETDRHPPVGLVVSRSPGRDANSGSAALGRVALLVAGWMDRLGPRPASSWSMIRSARSMATGRRPPKSAVERVVQELEQHQHRHDHRHDRAHQHRLDDGPLAAVGEEQHVDEDHDRDEPDHQPQRLPG